MMGELMAGAREEPPDLGYPSMVGSFAYLR